MLGKSLTASPYFQEAGFNLIQRRTQGNGQASKLLGRPGPGCELSQGCCSIFLGTGQLLARQGEPWFEISRLAGLAHRAAQRIKVNRLFEVVQLGLPVLQLFVMTSDRSPGKLGLAANLGEPLPKPADRCRLIDSKSQRIRLFEVGRASKFPKQPPGLVFVILLKTLDIRAIVTRLLDCPESLLKSLDFIG